MVGRLPLHGLVAGFAQTPNVEPLATPTVFWRGIAPTLILMGGAIVLVVIVAVARRLPRWFPCAFTVVCALAAGAWAAWLWTHISADGPSVTLASAVGVDAFSVFVTWVVCGSVILTALLLQGYLEREGLEQAEPFMLLLLSASGGAVMASANDLIVVFVGLEILSIAVYVLAASHSRRIGSQEAGLKYFVLGAMASAFLLYGIALVYGATGSTNLGRIASFLGSHVLLSNGMLVAGLGLMLVGFGFKVAAVPFHTWTPDVYQGSPTPVVAYMASGVKTAGFAGLLRVFVATFGEASRSDWRPIVFGLAVLSLVVGSVLAVVQSDVKRMLAYSSIAHAGFILVGVEAASPRGTAAALFYLAAYTLMVCGTFGVLTLIAPTGDRPPTLGDLGGLGRRRPALALAMAILLFSQAGIPLTAGFFAKFRIIAAAVDRGNTVLAAIAMGASVISVFVYLRLVGAMYFGDETAAEGEDGRRALPRAGMAVVLLSVAGVVLLGVVPGAVLHLADRAVPLVGAAVGAP